MNKNIVLTALLGTLTLGAISTAEACTRVLWETETQGTFVTRTMDWSEPTDPHLVNYPKGTQYPTHVKELAFATSKYDVSGITTYGKVLEGMNSEGLSGNGLYDGEMDLNEETTVDDVGSLTYLRHLLSQFATVKEAVEYIEENPPTVAFIPEIPIRIALHFSLQDTNGDSAIIQFVDGKAKIWHGPQYRIMTNQPNYQQHLANVKRSKRGWGELEEQFSQTNIGTGGNINPEDRFIHASYFTQHLTEPTSIINGMVKLDSVTYKIPHDAPNRPINGEMAGYATEFSVNYHLQSGETLMRYQWGDNWTQLQFNIKEIQKSGKDVKYQLIQPNLIGNITDQVIASGK
ncbi:linear amide C-N hydrolase [Vibrio sp. SS-MA-C1-2]|uniref:linear amide C-N hydrolase n=1 Tax=Vibrio sp. SS-MA-C1-2 TaxID=2908646 RepID=UPI001F229668|nr:linear amide C-N hydrolase [Vibrio sp. SS-MA-C1-2]UJF16880.1 linear amide C-N hydrolase [Vibrio sp. SS-MA-C1-2]